MTQILELSKQNGNKWKNEKNSAEKKKLPKKEINGNFRTENVIIKIKHSLN